LKNRRILTIALLTAAVIVLAILPVFLKDNVITVLIYVLLYICLASSWNILGGFTGQTNLGHAAFFGVGSLVTRYLWVGGLPFVPSFFIGGMTAVTLALIIGYPAFKLRGVYFAIGTLALAQILSVTVGNMLPEMSYNPDISDYLLAPRYYLFLALALLTAGVAYWISKSRLGLGMMAVREGEEAAESLGVSALKHKLIALLISAFLGGLAGGAFAYFHVSYYYYLPFGPTWTFDSMMMAYIGGTNSIIGPIIGPIFFIILKQLLVWNVGDFHLIIFGTLFIIVVLFLPGGLVEAWKKLLMLLKNLVRRKKAEAS